MPRQLVFVVGFFLAAVQALAEDKLHSAYTPAVERMARSGCANQIAPWARCTYDQRYWGQYVGGGLPCFGEERYIHEGTWGVNYSPRYSKIRLNWSHGARHQDGGGQFHPDGKVNPFSPEH